ncbi:MAG: acyltransferase [Myxococcales bacterium]|nr:acyltransferase [Myxococcales bacterium]
MNKRIVKCGLIQAGNPINDEKVPVAEIQRAMLEKHLPMIEEAGQKGVQILCLQEIFNGPYFCPSKDTRWYDAAEPVPGPTVERLAPIAKKYNMAMVIPVYEREMAGVYYNTAAVVDHDGRYLGKYRKNHIPDVNPGFFEKFFFKPGNLGYPTFKLSSGVTIGVYICYDRHFPEGARLLGLHGAEIVFNPSATVAGLSQYLWKIEQPAHAVANGYFMGCSNRVGTEGPWNIGKFYGTSYFVDPRGNLVAVASEDKDELVIADLDLAMIEETRRTWQFYRDRRPDSYGDMVKELP